MKSFLLAALAILPSALAASRGCKAALPANLTPGVSTHNITISSKSVIGNITDRQYILYLPAGFSANNDVAAPLIMAFHGSSQPAWSMERITELSKPEFNPNSIMVYPQAMNVQSPGLQWLGIPSAPPSSVIDDRIFVAEILDHLSATLCIDTSRIYATGLSNGGSLTGLLMCSPTLNKRFAAFATVGGAFYNDSALTEPLFGAGCKPELAGRVLPFMSMHGLADGVVPFEGRDTSPVLMSAEAWVDEWAQRGACVGPVKSEVENATVAESSWACGGKKDEVKLWAIDGFGHGWPSVKNQGEPFETLRHGPVAWNASVVLMEWFAKWSL
ncbi:alpha/beta-hydrolase [Lizonia empirigonia]|nr:alpha/beta-hydrolase [Lizonia empirigonia]